MAGRFEGHKGLPDHPIQRAQASRYARPTWSTGSARRRLWHRSRVIEEVDQRERFTSKPGSDYRSPRSSFRPSAWPRRRRKRSHRRQVMQGRETRPTAGAAAGGGKRLRREFSGLQLPPITDARASVERQLCGPALCSSTRLPPSALAR